ncbi:MAG: hypothetical protein AAF512_18115 [Pseudomonadota bacterium]
MSTRKYRFRKGLTLAAASKFVLGAGSAMAQTGGTNSASGLGKGDVDEGSNLPPLTLNQICTPFKLCTPPLVGLNEAEPVAMDGGELMPCGVDQSPLDPMTGNLVCEPNRLPQCMPGQDDFDPVNNTIICEPAEEIPVCLTNQPSMDPFTGETVCLPLCMPGQLPVSAPGDEPMCITEAPVDDSKNATDAPPANVPDQLPVIPGGIIWTAEIPPRNPDGSFPANAKRPRIDFTIGGIRNDMTMQVLLTASIVKPQRDAAPTLDLPLDGAGDFELDFTDPDNFKVIGGVLAPPVTPLPFAETPLGRVPATKRTRTVSISLNLNDLQDPFLSGNRILFQAFASPLDANGGIDVANAQASEVDEFIIDRVQFDSAGQAIAGSGSKEGSDGSKLTGGGADNDAENFFADSDDDLTNGTDGNSKDESKLTSNGTGTSAGGG